MNKQTEQLYPLRFKKIIPTDILSGINKEFNLLSEDLKENRVKAVGLTQARNNILHIIKLYFETKKGGKQK